MLTLIDQAGSFPVTQIQCPYFSELVDLDAPRAGILHTTEGGWDPSAGVFAKHWAPHFMVGLNDQGDAEIAQLVPIGTIGAAIVTHNNLAIVQIEMVGYAKENLWLPDPKTLAALAALMKVCRDEWGIPLTHPWQDGDYGRYGDNPHRDSGKFGTVAGWYGHADVPLPDSHWDPGNIEWSKIFAAAETS